MAHINLKSVTKTYESGVVAMDDITLDVADGEFLTVVGPSGCGKSTMLRLIAGLETPTSGDILINGINVNNVPPAKRDIAMVFQNDALYPHMNVYKNITVGMANHGVEQTEIQKRVGEAAKALDIADLLLRSSRDLSGGQKQRVALARAIVREPSVFLLDEPLSDLDASMRNDLRATIIALHKKLGTTFVYVTHDQTEALTMGNRLAVMRAGIIEQIGAPNAVYKKPNSMFVAGFIGNKMNFLDCTIENETANMCGMRFDIGDRAKKLCGSVAAGIRPEHIRVQNGGGDGVDAEIVMGELVGATLYLHTQCCGANVVAAAPPDFSYVAGQVIRLEMDASAIYLFDQTTGKVI